MTKDKVKVIFIDNSLISTITDKTISRGFSCQAKIPKQLLQDIQTTIVMKTAEIMQTTIEA